MKRLVFPLLVLSLVLILPVLTGCPQEPEVPSNNQEDDASGGKPNDGQENDADSNGGGQEEDKLGDNSGDNQKDDTSDDNPGDGDKPGDGDDSPGNNGQADDDPPADIPSGNLGDGPLVLKGKVFTEEVSDLEVLPTYTYTPDTRSGVVGIYSFAPGVQNEWLGEGSLTSGEFTISVTKKPVRFASISTLLSTDSEIWGGLKVDPAAARGCTIYLTVPGAVGPLEKKEVEVSGDLSNFSGTDKYVYYLYVDRDTVITLGERKTMEGPATVTYKAAVLELTKGWNALFWNVSFSGSASGFVDGEFLDPKGASNVSMSVGNPELKWISIGNDQFVDIGDNGGGTGGGNGGGDAGFNDPGIGYGQFPNNSFFSAP
jgi:hypothetical protein